MMKIDVKKKIGHGYQIRVIYSLDYLNTPNAKSHRRLKVFHHKGVQCARCGIKGEYVIATVDRVGHRHIDVYTKDLVLMTIDHIYPKSKGGSEDLSNKQPMCSPCNSEKGSKVETELPKKDLEKMLDSTIHMINGSGQDYR